MKKVVLAFFLIFLIVLTSIGYHFIRQEKILAYRGHQHYDEEQYSQAIDYYLQSIDKGERKYLVFKRLEESLLHQNGLDAIGAMYITLIAKYPKDLPLLQMAAHFQISNNDFDAAANTYRQMLDLDGDNQTARLWLARILSWTGKYEEAIREFQSLLGE